MALRPIDITDPTDERLLPYRQLNDPARRLRVEAGEGIFVVEGRLAIEQLVGSAYPVSSVLVAPERLKGLAGLLAEVGAPVYVAPREVVAATVGFDLHRGVVAVGRRVPPADAANVVATARTILVIEGVNDHENLGALFRNARALGAGAVLLDPTCADPLYRRSIRVSLGHVLRLPFARLDPWPAGLADLGAGGFTVVALTPDPAAVPIEALGAGWLRDEAARKHGRRGAVSHTCQPESRHAGIALVVGAEGPGLSAGARAAADVEVRIPMVAGVDSLNVATAAAIALQRLAEPAPA